MVTKVDKKMPREVQQPGVAVGGAGGVFAFAVHGEIIFAEAAGLDQSRVLSLF